MQLQAETRYILEQIIAREVDFNIGLNSLAIYHLKAAISDQAKFTQETDLHLNIADICSRLSSSMKNPYIEDIEKTLHIPANEFLRIANNNFKDRYTYNLPNTEDVLKLDKLISCYCTIHLKEFSALVRDIVSGKILCVGCQMCLK